MDMGVLWGYIVYAKANSQQTLTDSVSRRPVPALYVDMRRVGSGWVSDRGLPLSVGEPYSAGGGVTSSPLSPQAAATDPTSSCIDISILTTGLSAAGRERSSVPTMAYPKILPGDPRTFRHYEHLGDVRGRH